MWFGFVGKEEGIDEFLIFLDWMLDLILMVDVNGVKFEGVDLFLFYLYIDFDVSDDGLCVMVDKIVEWGFNVGFVVVLVWFGMVGGFVMGSDEDCLNFVLVVKKVCWIVKIFNEYGVWKYGVICIDLVDGL